jgi:hypothetical protein
MKVSLKHKFWLVDESVPEGENPKLSEIYKSFTP